MAKHYDKQFKLDAVQYYHDHKNLGLQGCATNLGISQQTLSRWQKELRETGDIESRGSGNDASDEAKEIARLKLVLRDAQDALEVLKKQSTFWKMTEAIYLKVTEMAETAHKAKRRVSVSGMLKHLGVSPSGYHAWLKLRVPSNTEKRRKAVKAKKSGYLR